MSIQKSLTFDTNDQIPLELKLHKTEFIQLLYLFADGLFGTTTQDIYLEDRTLGITHDLRTVPYKMI